MLHEIIPQPPSAFPANIRNGGKLSVRCSLWEIKAFISIAGVSVARRRELASNIDFVRSDFITGKFSGDVGPLVLVKGNSRYEQMGAGCH